MTFRILIFPLVKPINKSKSSSLINAFTGAVPPLQSHWSLGSNSDSHSCSNSNSQSKSYSNFKSNAPSIVIPTLYNYNIPKVSFDNNSNIINSNSAQTVNAFKLKDIFFYGSFTSSLESEITGNKQVVQNKLTLLLKRAVNKAENEWNSWGKSKPGSIKYRIFTTGECRDMPINQLNLLNIATNIQIHCRCS
jgi:hypothetical protein